MLRALRRRLCPDLAIDLGTANTRVAVEGRGIVLEEPSVVALARGSRKVLGRGTAVGKLARQMLGRTPDSITAVKPLHDGVITDHTLCEAMLKYLLQKAAPSRAGLRPRVVVSVPGSITPVEKRAVFNCLERAGAGEVFLIAEPFAAALGAGLPISEPLASMVCDVGAGTTDVAVFSLGASVARHSVRIAGDEFDQAIAETLHEQFSLKIGLPTAEQLKRDIGSAAPLDQELTAEVRGRDTASGVPRRAIITSEQVRAALKKPLHDILNCLKQVLDQCDPELVADLVDRGLILTGGSSHLRGLDQYLADELNIPVRVESQPERIVIQGATICLDHVAEWRHSLEGVHDAA
jgi:rod shape-determining protein MreB